MRRRNYFVLAVLSGVVSANHWALATNYYVDDACGDDSLHDGTSPACPDPPCTSLCAGPKKTIQKGLEIPALVDGDVVIVLGVGVTYQGAGNRDLFFPQIYDPLIGANRAKRITLRSEGGAQYCTINAGGSSDPGHRCFFFNVDRADKLTIVEGFTLTGGYVNSPNNGGAIYISSSSPTIRGCIIKGNHSGVSGGAIYVTSAGGAQPQAGPLILNCRVIDNTSKGSGHGIALSSAGGSANPAATISECLIRCNKPSADAIAGSGGGIYISGDSNAIIKRSVIAENVAKSDNGPAGGAGLFGGQGLMNILIYNCVFAGNYFDDGGPVTYKGQGGGIGTKLTGGTTRIMNCLIAYNHAKDGAGLFLDNDTYIDNTTIVKNEGKATASYGAGIYSGAGVHRIQNSIVYWNTMLNPCSPAPCNRNILCTTKTCVQSSDIELGMYCVPASPCTPYVLITGDPLVVDDNGPDNNAATWEDNDFRLLDTSPCRNTGNNTLIPKDLADIDEDGVTTGEDTPWDLDREARRYLNGVVDMGTHENSVQCPAGSILVDASLVPADGTVDARQPFPLNAISPRQGIGWNNGSLTNKIQVKLTSGATTANKVSCWSACETYMYPETQNRVESVVYNGTSQKYEITLRRALTAGAATTLRYVRGANHVTYYGHPANVNGDSASGAYDITALVNCLNGVDPQTNCPWGIYSCDIDHGGLCQGGDITRVVDLLNGANTFMPWLNVNKPATTGCPFLAACGSGMSGGGNPSASEQLMSSSAESEPFAEDIAEFIDSFVTFATTYEPVDGKDEEELFIALGSLTQWSVDNLFPEERMALAGMFSDPTLVFASKIAEDLVPQITEALTKW